MAYKFRMNRLLLPLGAAAMLLMPLTASAQGDPYGVEAGKYPDAASKPTPKMADGHPEPQWRLAPLPGKRDRQGRR